MRVYGFLDLLKPPPPGVAVMSDRGYDNFPALRQRGVELIIPSLSHTMGKGAGRERAPSRRRSLRTTGSPTSASTWSGCVCGDALRAPRACARLLLPPQMMRSIKALWRTFHRSIPEC